MADYWERIANGFINFCKPGDILEYTETFRKEDSECQLCQLCGKKGIYWNHGLLNNRTNNKLYVGSECIKNIELLKDKYDFRISNQDTLDYALECMKDRRYSIKSQSQQKYNGDSDFEQEDFSEFSETEHRLIDDLAPEGMGSDEIDYDSEDYDPTEK